MTDTATEKRFYPPTNDIIFHCLFGAKGQERVTKAFLESILKKEICDLDLDANLELMRSYYEDKLQIADVVGKDKDKNRYILEMQNKKYGYLPQRFLSSACKAYIAELKSSQEYTELKKIAIIIIMMEEFPNIGDIEKYHTVWNFREEDVHNKILTDDIEIHVVEIPKYIKQKKKNGKVEPWLEFIVNPNGKEVKEAMKKYKTIQEAVDELNRLNANEEVRMLADLQLFAKLDRNTEIALAKDEGKEEGRAEKKYDIAKALLNSGVDEEIIIKTTGVTKEEIEKLKRN